MNYLLFPVDMSLKAALAQASPHFTTNNVVFVPNKVSTVLLSRRWFKRKKNLDLVKDTQVACVNQEGEVRVLGKVPNEFTR